MKKELTDIEQKFSDITEIFVSDGYKFLVIRSQLEKFASDAKEGDTAAAQLVDIFNKFHKLCKYLAK